MVSEAAVLRRYREFCVSAPDELTTGAGFAGTPDGTVFAISVCYAGDISTGESVLGPLRSIGNPIADTIQPVPYLQAQALSPNPPGGVPSIMRGRFFQELNDDVEDALSEFAATAPPIFLISIMHMHGAVSR